MARWQVDLDIRELEEVASAVFPAEAMVARYMALYKADKEAVKAVEATAGAAVEADLAAATLARAHWD
jgi:hypothetical protein